MGDIVRRAAANVVAVSLFAVVAGEAVAQPPRGPAGPPAAPPTVSPYLNLARTGTSPAISYYGIVRPENEFRRAYQGLQSQADTQQLALQGLDARTGLPTTGHSAVFLNTGSYFMTLSPSLGQFRSGVGPAQSRPVGQTAPPTHGRRG